MSMETWFPILLIVQGAIGGVDTLWNHEYLERLPYRAKSRNEIGLHAVRESLYGGLFGGLAWWHWHGLAAYAIGALLLGEMLITTCDELVENHSRILPQNERVLHVFLTLNLGALIAVLTPVLLGWAAKPTGWIPASHGMVSWILSALSLAAFTWSVRDVLAWKRLGRVHPDAPSAAQTASPKC